MIKYSFDKRYSNNTKEEAEKLLRTSEKQILWTNGIRFRNPVICDRPIDREYALELFSKNWCDVDEYEDRIMINTLDSNDLW